MEPWRLSVHPIYGSIYRDGEFVQRGAILGLNTQANGVVVAPASGWVRIVRAFTPNDAAKEADKATSPKEVFQKEAMQEETREMRVDYIAVEIWPTART